MGEKPLPLHYFNRAALVEGAMTLTFIILVVGVMTFFPKTALGTYLRKLIVEGLAEKLNASTLTRIVFLTSLLLMGVAVIHFSKGQVDPFLAQVGAEAAPWFISFDLLTFVDVVTAVLLLRLALRFTIVVYSVRRIAARFRSQLKQIARTVHQSLASRRQSRSPAKKIDRSGASDDDGGLSPWAMRVMAA
jgi:hypothetical protein